SRMSVLYNGLYKTIQGANNIINHYQETKGDPATIKTIAGEAYFLRGFCYLWLTRLYGSIPLITTAEFSEDELSIERTSPKEVYMLIENDLKNAADMLPNQRREVGRPNKGSAQSFLALAYLTQGGWPIKDHSKYDSAATIAKKVIEHHNDYSFKFMSSYANIFKNNAAKGTSEDVYGITTNKNQGGIQNANIGKSAMPEDLGGWGDYFAEIGFYNRFPAGPRKDATFKTQFVDNNGDIINYKDL